MAQRPLNPAQQLEGGARGLVGQRTLDGSRAPSRAAMLRRFWVDANQAFHEAGARGSGL